MKRISPFRFLIRISLAALAVAGCSAHRDADVPGGLELSGRGYVHYHPYPDTGQCYCGAAYDFTVHRKMIAAASETIHHYFHDSLCENRKYAYLVSQSTGKSIRVLIVDKGGQPTDDFNRNEQHIMDISEEAFKALDVDGRGYQAGRIYVDWEIRPAE
jgi:hypothetical protein